MGAHSPWIAPLILALVLVNFEIAVSFKAEEFKKCDQASFCKRHRTREPDRSTYSVTGESIIEGKYAARLVNSASPEAEIYLEISAYDDGIVRVHVNESPLKRRFEVPDIIVPEFEKRRVHLKPTRFGGPATSSGLRFGSTDISVRHNPFVVDISSQGQPVLSLNSRGLFAFEHLREKPAEGTPEDGEWTETFRSFTDSKPRGPEAISLDVSFHNVDHVYGIPERALSFELQPTRGPGVESEPYRLYNLDVFEYLSDSPFGLYGSIPFMLGHSSQRGQTAGFFWLNAAEMFVDVLGKGWDGSDSASASARGLKETHWIAESGVLDGFFFVGPSPKDVVRQYALVTGTTAMPQMFAIGYHQCRWNYRDEADVYAVDKGFDDHDIPYDVIWLDIEHTDGKKYMTWDHANFPHPVEMQHRIAAKGRKMVTIVDPHVKRDDSFPLHKEATEKGYYVKNAGGGDYDGWCWPGSSSYLDVTNPQIRSWWADKFSLSNYQGSTPFLYIWNDMNEPSVFNGPEVTMPKDNLHYNNVEHRDVHNAYGMYYHMATAEGLLRRGNHNDRPFVLSRAIFAGTQRVGPIWTGDNAAEWAHLQVSIPMLLSLGVTGMAFSGADVGGFFGNPDAELITRWYQIGTFYPFFRGHAHLDTKRREPWLFGEPYTSIIRTAIKTRYALLPYVYTLFREAYVAGTPVMRPLWMEFPHDAENPAHEFLLGHALLVRPVVDQGATSVDVYLPGNGPWYDMWTGQAQPGGSHLMVPVVLTSVPAYQRGGTIIPRKDRPRRASSLMTQDPYTLVVALDSEGKAQGELYEDDGKSYGFTRGGFIHRRFTFASGRIESRDAAPPGTSGIGYSPTAVVERVIILGVQERGSLSLFKRAMVQGGFAGEERDVVVEPGPPVLQNGAPSNALIVRLPNVPINSDWTITLVSSQQE